MWGFLLFHLIVFLTLSMSKAEALQAVTNEGSIGKFGRSPAWEKAFEAYNAANNEKLRPSCGSCFRKVLRWMKG